MLFQEHVGLPSQRDEKCRSEQQTKGVEQFISGSLAMDGGWCIQGRKELILKRKNSRLLKPC